MVKTTVGELIDIIANNITRGKEFKDVQAIMLWGSPGIGKSQMINEIAEIISKERGLKANVKDCRLATFDPMDIKGLPYLENNKTYWSKPYIMNLNESDDYFNILFLDELSAAPPSIQVAAYQLILDRQIGDFKLPDNTLIICAGNKKTDSSVSFTMSKALCNRMKHFEVECDFDDWKMWAIKNKIDPRIVGYLSSVNGRNLYDNDLRNTDNAYCTPRSWDMLSRDIKQFTKIDDSNKNLFFKICGATIGEAVTSEFLGFCIEQFDILKFSEIVEGKYKEFDFSNIGKLYALLANIVYEIGKQQSSKNIAMEDLSKNAKGIFDFVIYLINSSQAEFGAMLFKEIKTVSDKYEKEFRKQKEYEILGNKLREWLK